MLIAFNKTISYALRREHDQKVEKNVAKILDALYKENGLDIERNTTDVEAQKRGIDIVMTKEDGSKMKIDEKSASTYFHKHLGTFAFELSSKNNRRGMGWFDPKNTYIETEAYMLAYPYAKGREELDPLETVDEMEALLIRKSVIWEYLHQNGIDSVEKAKELLNEKGIITTKYNKRVTSCEDGIPAKRIYTVNDNIRIVESFYLEECPINIVVSRDVLRSLADKVLFKKY